MFNIIKSQGNHRLSFMFNLKESKRRGNEIEMNKTITEFGRQSLFFRGTVVWNYLDKNAKNSENITVYDYSDIPQYCTFNSTYISTC